MGRDGEGYCVRPRSKTFILHNNNLFFHAFKQTLTNIGICSCGMKEAFLACEHGWNGNSRYLCQLQILISEFLLASGFLLAAP